MVLHTSTPSFASDVKTVRALKAANPNLKIGMIGAKVAVDAAGSLAACEELDFVARNEFDFTIKEVAEGRDFGSITGLSYRGRDGRVVHNTDRAMLHNMDELPFVSPVYKRDLEIENYFIGYLRHPYLSFYTGRGCKSRCTFCLWPQTVGGHNYRTRSVGHVIDELKWAMKAFPQVKEVFFDDDTLTDDLPRVEAARPGDRQARHRLGLQRQGQRAAQDPRSAGQQRLPAVRRRLRDRQPADPAQHQEGHAGRRREEVHQGLPRAWHQDPRHLHPRPARRDQGNHPGNHPLRQGHQPAHHPDFARGALSRHVPVQAGQGERLVRHQQRRSGRRQRHPDRAAALSAPEPRRDFQLGRGVLQSVLFPRAEDRLDRQRDGALAADDEAQAARGRRVLPVPARAAARPRSRRAASCAGASCSRPG